METISSRPKLSSEPTSDELSIEISHLDNWRYHRVPMAFSGSDLPLATGDQPESPSLDLDSVGLNINEDDLDCPGYLPGRLTGSSSSGTLSSSGGDDGWRLRALSVMSVDDGGSSVAGLSVSSVEGESSESRRRTFSAMSVDDDCYYVDSDGNNNVRLELPPHLSWDEDEEYEDSDSDDEALKTPTGCGFALNDPRPPAGLSATSADPRPKTKASLLRVARRPSLDGGVAASRTPGTPGTPQEDQLQVDPEKVFQRIYDLLCAERVTQMTKTYNDIEAVTRLLEEKERDLELAARIGQTLLSKNKELSVRADGLDEQLSFANEKVSQLKHDLLMKDELLKFYCEDLQDQTSGASTPSNGPNLSKLSVEMLQNKVGTLEEENLNLRLESAQLRSDTDNYEEKEKKLVEDCLQQLAELNQQVETFAGELRLKTEESSRQKEEITHNLVQVADLHKRVRQLTIENMDLAEKLQASQESQKQLTKELCIQRDRYDELMEMLDEAQDELRGYRNRGNPKATRHMYASSAMANSTGGLDSLASELESSLLQEKTQKEDLSARRARSWKVFETARAARKAASKSSRDSSIRMSTSASTSLTPSQVNSDNESFNSDGYSADMDSMYGSSSELGRPGIPGSNDLESALRRLAMRRANDMNERDFQETLQASRYDSISSFRSMDTPDSMASPPSGYSYLGCSANAHTLGFKIPDKLQIVKPLEGSVTLRHWQRLAQPHLGGLFERREGVKVRGERKLDLEGEEYTLSEFEEDDEEVPECPSRRMADSSTIYTFTNSMVNEPSVSSGGSSFQPAGTSTPHSQPSSSSGSRGNSYTMSLGLAALLNSRETSSTTALLRPIASCPLMPSDPATSNPTSIPSSASSSCLSATSLPGVGEESRGSASGQPTTPTAGGLFGKLINTGYSLLWNKGDNPSPTQLPEATSGEEKKPSASQILPQGSATGVLGAMSAFRKNGIL